MVREQRREIQVRKITTSSIAVLSILLALASMTGTALAQYLPPVPPTPIIIRETVITVSYTAPKKVIVIDVTQFDAGQVVKMITITLKKPVLTASLTIYLLGEKPPELPTPPLNKKVLHYYTIRARETLLDNIEHATTVFAVEKTKVKEKVVDSKTIKLNRFFKGKWEELSTETGTEDEILIFFKSESTGLSNFAITGNAAPAPFPWWLVIAVMAVVGVLVGVGIYLYR
jgi:PGF-pre-PGF domain-containing protein